MARETNAEKGTGEATKPKRTFVEILAVILLLVGVVWTISLFFDFSNGLQTNNAQVTGDIATVTSRVSGYIVEIKFNEYGTIHAGDTLVLLDASEFIIKVAKAEADLAIAEANLAAAYQAVVISESSQLSTEARLQGNQATLEKAEKNYTRFQNMYKDSAVTLNQFDQATAQLKSEQAYLKAMESDVITSKSVTAQNRLNIESSKATVKSKVAELDAAKLQLSYTSIIAPVDGIVGERTIQPGELVNVNQVVAEVVMKDRKWVTANFKETQMEHLEIGQEVEIMVDALGGKVFEGVISDLSPATGAKFSMVAPDNSTGNFVKITQRIPVRIEFVSQREGLNEIIPGMNVTVKIKKQ